MTVVEAYICGERVDLADANSKLPPNAMSFLLEGIALNTTGSVFLPEVG